MRWRRAIGTSTSTARRSSTCRSRRSTLEQSVNYGRAAEITALIRDLEPAGVTISVGGEIGEVGKTNSTVADLRAYLDGLPSRARRPHARRARRQQGERPDRARATAGSRCPTAASPRSSSTSRSSRSSARSAGPSTGSPAPSSTGRAPSRTRSSTRSRRSRPPRSTSRRASRTRSTTTRRSRRAPRRDRGLVLRERRRRAQGGPDGQQFVYTTRKKAIGPFKRQLWELATKDEILASQGAKIAFLFDQLGVVGSRAMVDRHVEPGRGPSADAGRAPRGRRRGLTGRRRRAALGYDRAGLIRRLESADVRCTDHRPDRPPRRPGHPAVRRRPDLPRAPDRLPRRAPRALPRARGAAGRAHAARACRAGRHRARATPASGSSSRPWPASSRSEDRLPPDARTLTPSRAGHDERPARPTVQPVARRALSWPGRCALPILTSRSPAYPHRRRASPARAYGAGVHESVRRARQPPGVRPRSVAATGSRAIAGSSAARLGRRPAPRVADVACGPGWSAHRDRPHLPARSRRRHRPRRGARSRGAAANPPSTLPAWPTVSTFRAGTPRRPSRAGPLRPRDDPRGAPRHGPPGRGPGGGPRAARTGWRGAGRGRAGGRRLHRARRRHGAHAVRLQRRVLPGRGLYDEPSVGTGTMLRPDVVAVMARDAGFSRSTVLATEHDQFRFYRLDP